MPNRLVSFYDKHFGQPQLPASAGPQQLMTEAQRQQMLAQGLSGRAMQSRIPQQQGPVAARADLAPALGQIGEALLARRLGKQANQSMSTALDARQQALAKALGGTAYAPAQAAVDAGADPGLVGSMIKSREPQALSAGAQLVDPQTGEVIANNPAQVSGSNSRYGSPQIMESGRIAALDRATGRLQYTDTGQPVDPNDKASADLTLMTLPDGSVQVVNMRREVASQAPGASPRAEELVSQDTALAGAVAKEGATTMAREQAQTRAEAMADLPRVESNASQALTAIDQLLNHPGFEGLFGASGMLQPQIVPGSKWADANALLKQVQGKTFLEAYQTLKGGGQITELEGTKAEQAIARLSRAQSDEAAKQALQELRNIAIGGLQRAYDKAGMRTDNVFVQGQDVEPPAPSTDVPAVSWEDLQ